MVRTRWDSCHIYILLLTVLSLFHFSQGQNNIQIRLAGASSAYRGRVEVLYNNTWGTVCDDHFDQNAAKVVCRMLGLYVPSNFILARSQAYYGPGNGPIWLDDVTCTGNEQSLLNCRLKPFGRQNCNHNEDVAVDCNAAQTPALQVRLRGGTSSTEGRVEVFYNNTWGTVCDDEWNDKSAGVICRMLNIQNAMAVPLGNAYFGNGTGPIWLDDVKCIGTEPQLGVCNHKPFGITNCQHNEDAGVMCIQGASTNPINIRVRLAGGLNRYQGRVEINVFNKWGTICDDSFDTREANVICQMLGYTRGGTVISGRSFGGGNGPIWLDDLECRGNETNIASCVHKPWGVNNCGHDEDVAVQCKSNTVPQVNVRLANGPVSTEGRVEVQYNGNWGTVCDDKWSNADAAVICRMLHLPFSGAVAVSKSAYGPGTGTILLDDVVCVGTETTIANCNSRGWGVSNCAHSEDAGVICQDLSQTVSVRLSGGSFNFDGRVEVFYNNTWGTICDDSFGVHEATVICKQLGFAGTGAIAKGSAFFGPGSSSMPILLDDLNCAGTETNIAFCGHRGWGNNNCQHSEDAAVICSSGARTNGTSIRLVGGTNANEGRLEVFHGGVWGTVCDDYFDNVAAQVVCKMLHLPWRGAQPKPKAFYGQGSGQILLDNVICRGNETDISYCRHQPWGRSNCQHSEDVGVACGNSLNYRMRLVNGSSTSEGRLEIFYNNTWGTVCDDSFDNNAAAVVCHKLGFARSRSTAVAGAVYGQGTGPILLDDVYCSGTENSLIQCRNKGWYINNCDHTEDVGVVCNSVQPRLRLVGGNRYRGRVEIKIGSNWGTICDDKFDAKAAKVVCRMLHLPYQNALPLTAAAYGQGTGSILLDDVVCQGNETSILNCNTNPIGINDCDHTEDVSVICSNTQQSNNIQVRLYGGTASEGLLQVNYGGQWGTVCDDDFTDAAAKVVCNMLHLTYVQAHAIPSARYKKVAGTNYGPIWLDGVKCNGTESSLANCQHQAWGSNDCDHTEDIAVTCESQQALNVQIRLVNGTSNSGRVEVNHGGQWGTICDDGWGVPEATVACRMLGKPTGVVVPLTNAYWGQGSGTIWIDDIDCVGNETNIGMCQRKPWGTSDCDHTEDAGVICLAANPNPPPVTVRLVGGLTRSQGRVEVKYNGVWGSVCDDSWDNRDATVVCRMLGYNSPGARALTNIGSGTGAIWMDDVECRGMETNIANCTFKGWGENNCDHSEDAGAFCIDSTVQNLRVRLVNGGSNNQGRVEVFFNNQWGTVCDDKWTNADAQVVCRMLGFSTDGATAYSNAHYGSGNGSILLDDVTCIGTESNIGQCKYSGLGINNCDHTEDASVKCNTAGSVVTPVQVRLVGGSSANEGRVEVFYNNTWGTICDDYWDYRDATVICSMLGLSTFQVQAKQRAFYGQGTGPIWLDNVNCMGNESSISLCGNRGWGISNCRHSEDASVVCGAGTTNPSSVRVVGGSNRFEGRVEVFHNNQWGTVCDDGADYHVAQVICRQLGIQSATAAAVKAAAYFGPGTGQIWMDDVRCSGTERSLDACRFRPWGQSNCAHNEDLSVICRAPSIPVRLVDSVNHNPNQGRVEIQVNGTWGTVCDDLFNSAAASVVCSMMGYSRTGAIAKPRAFFGRGTGPILLDDVRCAGSEKTLLQCSTKRLGQNNCGHDEDVGVICGVTPLPVRLVQGTSRYNGRLEIQYNGTWGTVCDDYFTSTSAKVVCSMLGYPTSQSYALGRANYGSGTGTIWLDDVKCRGNETSLAQCPHRAWGSTNCRHTEDVGVVCTNIPRSTTPRTTPRPTTPRPTPDPTQTFVRLVGGSDAYQGRVEVFAFGTWGTVCDDGWNIKNAGVICGMLGYTSTGATAKKTAAYGAGAGKIWLDNVVCAGVESSITQCRSNGWGVNNCGHNEDAGVVCSDTAIPDNFLLITDTRNKTIYRMDLTSKSYLAIPLHNHDNPIAIDYDPIDSRIYWTDVGSHQIRSAGLDGNNEKIIRQLSATAIMDGIAVDPVSRLLFYTDTGNNVIVVMTLDGQSSKVVINQNLDEPRAIVVNPQTGKFYWTDWGSNARIETANYDGSGRKILVSTGLTWPNGLTIDFQGGVMYWCDGNTGHIGKSNLDGSGRTVILDESARSPHYFGIVLYQTTLYFTDWSRSTVMQINTDGSGLTSVGPSGFGRLNDIHMHKNGAGFSGQNGCTNGKGGCSHICLPGPGNTKKCACPDGLTLQPDRVSCSVVIPCRPLKTPANGMVTPAACTSAPSQPGTNCTVSCNTGYTLDGMSQLTCFSNGHWSALAATFRCRDSQPPQVTCPANIGVTADKGKQTATVTWATPTATDNSGKTVSVIQTLNSPASLGAGTYTVNVLAFDAVGQTSSCQFQIVVKVLQCQSLAPPTNGVLMSPQCYTYYGATCQVGCLPGYTLQGGSPTVMCEKDSTNMAYWTVNKLSCVARNCPNPPAPLNGKISGCTAPYSVGKTCTQSCMNNYTAVAGSTYLQCQSTGIWAGQQLLCSPVRGAGNGGINTGTGGQAASQTGSQRSASSSGSKTNYTGIVAGTVIGVVLVVLIVAAAFLYVKRMQWNLQRDNRSYEMGGMTNPNYGSSDT